MHNKGYYVVHGWMINQLGLKGVDLLVYAIIYGYTQIDEQEYFGTRRHLSESTGASISTIQRSLDSLVERSLFLKNVRRSQNGSDIVSYKVNLTPLCQNDTGVKMTHIDNKSISSYRVKFTKPTVEEVDDYCKEKGYSIDAAYFVDYYESKGWLVGKTPMKDWKAAVRTWVRHNQKDTPRQRRDPEVKFL